MRYQVTRRGFLKQAGVAGVAVFVAPRILRSASPNSGIRYAHIATGGRGGAHTGLASGSDVCVAYCDADKRAWGGVAKRYPDAKAYTDYRKMFDEMGKGIDAVTVATPDHNHAVASMLALKMGKAVYCEKPLTWSVQEARALAAEAAKQKVATQMGNQGHANEGNRLTVEWVRGGLIGDVQEIHTWTNRPVWPQGITSRPASAPSPETLDWDCWLGPAPRRDYHDGLHGFKWRGWFDFGCGAVGDMGCHTWDNVNWSMQTDYPEYVELLEINGKGHPETFPRQAHFKWVFPAKGDRKAFVAHWYEGGLKPAEPEELNETPKVVVAPGVAGPAKLPNPDELAGAAPGARRAAPKSAGRRGLPGSGTLYIGTKGKILVSGDYGDSPRLLPESRMKETKFPEKTLERSPGHHREWIMAIRGDKPWNYPGSNFTYAGPMTELMLLGCVVTRMGEVGSRVECDPVKREVKNKEAQQFIGRVYRKGWDGVIA